jgi:mannitol-1-/sugar-/sorbitol-6-/2-deoxyglucose-6-phosphatase
MLVLKSLYLRSFCFVIIRFMNRAFIFDMDGVLINDESIWENKKQAMYGELFGPEIHEKLGSTLGINMDSVYERALNTGTKVDKAKFIEEFHKLAGDIYSTTPIPQGTKELAEALLQLGYHIGIVSASPLSWITTVTKRLTFEDNIELIISLHERPDLKHKPEPDGYTEAMRALDATPDDTIILEDSNSGIESARTSGAYTIGLKQNLVDGYVQEGADAYAETMMDVIELVKKKYSLLA